MNIAERLWRELPNSPEVRMDKIISSFKILRDFSFVYVDDNGEE